MWPSQSEATYKGAASYKQILMKFHEKVHGDPNTSYLDFGGDPFQ